MIAKYTDHAANERTFLAWIRTGLAVGIRGRYLRMRFPIPSDTDSLPTYN
jgi:putative membrane protein